MTLLLALLPALVMITMVIITRKVLISLGVGIILAALIHEGFNPIDASYYIWQSFIGIVTDIHWYLPILAFVVLIGSITAVISLSGGVKAFASWAVFKVKTPVAAQLLTWVLGIIIMIDDYFNDLIDLVVNHAIGYIINVIHGIVVTFFQVTHCVFELYIIEHIITPNIP
jgi:Na+/H+ antiporter NhaC